VGWLAGRQNTGKFSNFKNYIADEILKGTVVFIDVPMHFSQVFSNKTHS